MKNQYNIPLIADPTFLHATGLHDLQVLFGQDATHLDRRPSTGRRTNTFSGEQGIHALNYKISWIASTKMTTEEMIHINIYCIYIYIQLHTHIQYMKVIEIIYSQQEIVVPEKDGE